MNVTNKSIEIKLKCADCLANKSLFHRNQKETGILLFLDFQ